MSEDASEYQYRDPLRRIQHLEAENAELRRRLAETQQRPGRGQWRGEWYVPQVSVEELREAFQKPVDEPTWLLEKGRLTRIDPFVPAPLGKVSLDHLDPSRTS